MESRRTLDANHCCAIPVLLHRRELDSAFLPELVLNLELPQRANIGNARVAGLEKDLNILPTQYSGYGYNLLLTAFYIAYVVL